MSYQSSLFSLAVMQDRSGTTSGYLRLPNGMKRGDCVGAAPDRLAGRQSCPFLTCKYHLVPELAKLRPKSAESAMLRRLEGEIVHTCTLDLSGSPDEPTPQDHYTIADALGIDRQAIAQREAEALHKFRAAVEFENRLQELNGL